ncbi:MAG TPA: hypothetical protein VKG79_08255, partial [Bryobacteraceae bacterium]|nr:hypothetical protein [Bryobacteraceae bacterium]
AHETRWAAATGLWEFHGDSASYTGPSSSEGFPPYGLALTNWSVTDGTVRVRVKFSELEPKEQIKGHISAGLVLGFQSERSRYVIVQLGAYGSAYSIGEYLPGVTWQGIENVGSARNLKPNIEYQIEVRQTGQEIRMVVDGVPVIERILNQPLSGTQLGLFAWGKERVDFRELVVNATKPQVFVAMQFGQPFDTLYQEVISPGARAMDLDVVRIDEMAGPGIIFEDIKRQIAESKIVIAEITAPNQNVFYELGYAHALNKPTILLAQRGKELPFDIRSYRVIFYDDSIGGKPALERNLQKHLEAILQS